MGGGGILPIAIHNNEIYLFDALIKRISGLWSIYRKKNKYF